MCIFWRKKKPQVESTFIPNKPVQMEEKTSALVSDVYIIEEVPAEMVEEEKKTAKIQKYHVSQNKEKDAEHYMMWRVRKEGSDKTIQFFDTQKLAIDYAQELADKAGSTVVIHKLDGSIRKQDYTK